MSKVFNVFGWGIILSSFGGLIAIIPKFSEDLQYVPYWTYGGIFILVCLAGWVENYALENIAGLTSKTYRFWSVFVLVMILLGGGFQCLIRAYK